MECPYPSFIILLAQVVNRDISETDTVDSADESVSAESTSQQITNDETVQEDTLDMDTSHWFILTDDNVPML
jgi:hypothetical protein